MKRTSILVLIACLMTQQIAIARHYVSSGYRVRYSMHAMSHSNSGLVPGYVRYSTNAYGFNNRAGLVDEWTRYSLHAFGIGHNGLISEYGPTLNTDWPGETSDLNHQKLTKAIDRLSHSIDNINSTCRTTQRGTCAVYSNPDNNSRTVKLDDLTSDNPRLLMRAFLNTLMPGQFKVSDLLRINQEVVSFNVVIEKRNLVIKYWNPEIVRSIQEASNQTTEQLSDYMKTWAAVEDFYDNKGDRVVHIVSTDQDKILMELTDCLLTKTM